jgi:hypothetical protein
MIRFITMAAVAALAFASQAQAFDVKLSGSLGKTKAEAMGGATSQSGVGGGSALIGTTSVIATNNSNAAGVVDARNGKNSSTVTQVYATNSTSAMQSSSLGLAGNIGGASGQAESIGSGLAVKKTGSLSVKIH